jgi:MFS family permease
LKIVSSQDLGNLCPKDGVAVIYNWRWYYSVPSLALWVTLALSISLVKANRNPHALLVLVPLLIVNWLWLILKKMLGFSSADAEMFNMLFYSLMVGIAILWLLAHKLGNRSRFVTFLLAFTIMAFVGLAGAVSYTGLEFSQQTGALILLAILVFAMLLAFVLTGWWCRKRYRPVSFMLWLAVWTVAANLVSMLVVCSIVFIVHRVTVPIPTVLFLVSVEGLILSAFLYVVVFPYMILALRSSFYRERFYACLRLKSMPTATGPVPEASVPQL